MATKYNVGKAAALVEAAMSEHKFRVGCVVARGNRILSRGRNSYKSHTAASACQKTHAEISALTKAHKHDLRGATVYVARLLRDGTQALAAPCNNCLQAAVERGVSKVVYTASTDGWNVADCAGMAECLTFGA